MPVALSLTLACLFVFLAGFNVWNMLAAPGASLRSKQLWTQAHRACGWTFIALFITFCGCMLLRIRGLSDELPPRILLHMGLAMVLAPLLLVKVIAARYQKAARGLLMALGIAIFAVAFTLVAINVSAHFLRVASTRNVPPSILLGAAAVVILAAAMAYFVGARSPKPRPAADAVPANREPHAATKTTSDQLTLTLARIERQAPDAKTLRFLLPPGQQLAARPGQFLTFEWMIDGKPVTRSYSICSSPIQSRFIDITPKRVAGGVVSQFLNDRAQVGLTVRARGPYGRFCFEETRHGRIVLIAGGSDITPMMAMLRYIDDLCLPVDITLIYCVRHEQDVFFKDELAALQSRLPGFRQVWILSQPRSGSMGWTGRLRREILEREIERLAESTFFLCGPPAFMEHARALLKEMAVDPENILQESFGGAVPGEAQPATREPGPLEVRFSRSAVVFGMSPNDNLLESSERNGVLLPSGCRQGQCGTCATKLLNGKVEMESEEALTDELRAQGFILPCVSRAVTDLTLDA